MALVRFDPDDVRHNLPKASSVIVEAAIGSGGVLSCLGKKLSDSDRAIFYGFVVWVEFKQGFFPAVSSERLVDSSCFHRSIPLHSESEWKGVTAPLKLYSCSEVWSLSLDSFFFGFWFENPIHPETIIRLRKGPWLALFLNLFATSVCHLFATFLLGKIWLIDGVFSHKVLVIN